MAAAAATASKLDVNLKKLQHARSELEYQQAARLRQEDRREAMTVGHLQKRLASLKAADAQRNQRNQRLLAAAGALAKRVGTEGTREDGGLSALVAARAFAGREQAAWVQSTLRSFTECVDQLVPVLHQAERDREAERHRERQSIQAVPTVGATAQQVASQYRKAQGEEQRGYSNVSVGAAKSAGQER